MDKRKDDALDYLVAELKKRKFKDRDIEFGYEKHRSKYWGGEYNEISIYFKSQSVFTELDPAYNKNLNGKISVQIRDEEYTVECDYPSSQMLAAIDDARESYYLAEHNQKAIKPFGCGYSSTVKHVSKKFKTAEYVLKWIDKFLELAYNSVVEGRAWWVSDSVKTYAKAYIDSCKIRSDFSNKISELEGKRSEEETRFNEYDRKFRDNFVRVRMAKADF